MALIPPSAHLPFLFQIRARVPKKNLIKAPHTDKAYASKECFQLASFSFLSFPGAMVDSIACLLSMLLVSFAGWSLYQWSKAPGKAQGPRPWLLLGNVWTIYKFHANPDAMCEQLGKYGDVCVLRLGSQPILVINSAKAAHEHLHTVRGYHLKTKSTNNTNMAALRHHGFTA
jgi:hypothetical protein